MRDVLCIYYSRTGNTKRVMETIAKEMDAELLALTDGVERSGLLRLNALLLKLLDEEEVLDERMVIARNLACQLQRALGGLHAMELIAMFQLDVLHATESPHEVKVPITATELTIRDVRQTVLLLLLDDISNQSILDATQVGSRNLSLCKLHSCFLQLGRAQVAAHSLKMLV